MILGVKGKDKEMKDVVVSRPDGSRIKIPVAVETMEEDDETVVESENNEGLKTTAFTQGLIKSPHLLAVPNILLAYMRKPIAFKLLMGFLAIYMSH